MSEIVNTNNEDSAGIEPAFLAFGQQVPLPIRLQLIITDSFRIQILFNLSFILYQIKMRKFFLASVLHISHTVY